jgi:hypothetical protein
MVTIVEASPPASEMDRAPPVGEIGELGRIAPLGRKEQFSQAKFQMPAQLERIHNAKRATL